MDVTWHSNYDSYLRFVYSCVYDMETIPILPVGSDASQNC